MSEETPLKKIFASFVDNLYESFPDDLEIMTLHDITRTPIVTEKLIKSVIEERIIPRMELIKKRDLVALSSCGLFDVGGMRLSEIITRKYEKLDEEERESMFKWYEFMINSYFTVYGKK